MLKFFDADPDPGSEIFFTLDPVAGMEKFGSGINIPDLRLQLSSGSIYQMDLDIEYSYFLYDSFFTAY
jgi:hypothetical protein